MMCIKKIVSVISVSAVALAAILPASSADVFAATNYAQLNIGSADEGDNDTVPSFDEGISLHVGVFGEDPIEIRGTVGSDDPDVELSVGETQKTVSGVSDNNIEEVVNVESAVNYVMANVSDVVNVRKEPSEDSEIAGKFYKNCTGKILEKGDGWTKIESGKLTGWVKNDFLLFDEDAENLMKEVGKLKATSQTDALRVRKEPGEDSGVYKLLELNETIEAVEELDGWVKVKVDSDTEGYVSADYVQVEFDADHGKTVAQLEAEKKEKEAAKLKKNRGAVATSSNDVTLLAALIQAEAGSQPYEGKVAVGAVVMNRVRSGGYPNSIQAVITQPGQFPPATNGTVAAILARGPSASCVQAAKAAVNGATTVGGALHFGSASRYGGIVIGGHAFY